MNHVFKLIWSRNLGMLVPVPEGLTAAARGERRVRRRIRRLAKKAGVSGVAAASALVLFPLGAAALPTGGQVVAGQAQISHSAGAMQVTQGSAKAILNWQDFGIAPGESVTFRQPSTSSVALNRVLGNNPSAIYGSLNANGQVFLVNPNGITFAQGAQVNVGGIVASTLGITNQDFLNGNYHFSGTSDAGVVNAGSVSAADGGYVAFIGRHVDNEGSITTPGGTTALGAGGAVDLTLAGNSLLQFRVSDAALKAAVKNGGAIQASDGRVILSAAAKSALMQTVVNNTGVIKAQGVRSQGGVIQLLGGSSGTTAVSGLVDASAPNGTGGSVVATGQHVVVKHGARVVATGSVGGGKIAIGGGVHGGSNIAQAQTTTVEQGAVLDASATVAGDGGQISVWSDVTAPGSLTQAYGGFTATGGAQGGNGGFIETSGHVLDANGATVDVSAAHGAAGTWLLDPYNLTVTTNSANSVSGTNYTASGADSTILASSVSAALATGNVTLQTTGTAGTQAGNITVDGTISWSANTQLTLNAAGSITVDAPITVTGTNASAGVNFLYGQGALAAGNTATEFVNAPINLPTTATFTTKLGSDGASTVYTVIDSIGASNSTTGADLQGISGNLSGNYVIGSDLSFSSGGTNNFTSIGTGANPFVGTLDGAGHKISGLSINLTGAVNVGLLGAISNGSIRNIGIENENVTGWVSVGGLVGYVFGANSLIQNVHTSGVVAATGMNAGGLVGKASAGKIENSYSKVNASGPNQTGGLVGSSSLSIQNSYASGAITGNKSAGGLVGINGGTVSNSYATGTVAGQTGQGQMVGGLVGLNTPTGKLNGVYAAGSATGVISVGGLVGMNNGGSVANAYAVGGVSGSTNVGGLVGNNNKSGTITDTYAAGNVSGTTGVGGLVGTNSSGVISNGYWDMTTTGVTKGVGGATSATTNGLSGLTTAQLAAGLPSGFASTIWSTSSNQTTPWLLASRSFDTVSGSVILGSETGATPTYYDVIATPTQLQNINATGLNGNYALGAKVDLSTIPDFSPIGLSTSAFSGKFNGLGFGISNLAVKGSNEVSGLFGKTSNAVVQDALVKSASVSGGSNVGVLVGLAYASTISGVHANGTVSGANDVGGLIGKTTNGTTVKNSGFSGSVSGKHAVGGLVGVNAGTNSPVQLVNDFAAATVVGTNNVGGLVGHNGSSTVSNSYATGTVSGVKIIGGLIGGDIKGQSSNVYSTSSVHGSTSNVGGLFGHVLWSKIAVAYEAGPVSGSSVKTGAFIGGSTNGSVTYGYWNSSANPGLPAAGQSISGTPVGLAATSMSNLTSFPGFSSTTTPGALGNSWVTIGMRGVLNGSGGTFPILASEYSEKIYNTHQLQLMLMNLGATYTLASSIDASATATSSNSVNSGSGNDVWGYRGFVPVGNRSIAFSGALDGLGYTISNLTITTAKPDVGLFGITANATIRNIGLKNASVSGGAEVGGLVGKMSNGMISGSYVTGNISGTGSNVGGLVGSNNQGAVTDAYATGTVTGTSSVGGLVGLNWSTMSNDYASGAVVGTGSNIGGLVGKNTSVTATIANAYATGNVTGQSPIGNNVGGLVGFNAAGSSISNAYATGNVTAQHQVGGVVGSNSNSKIAQTYQTGNVVGTLNFGVLVGRNYSGTVSNGHWNISPSGNATLAGIGRRLGSPTTNSTSGLTSSNMQKASNFPNFDFTGSNSTWVNYEGQTTPLLGAFLTPLTVSVTSGGHVTYNGQVLSSNSLSTSVSGSAPAGSLFGQSGTLNGKTHPFGTNARDVGSYAPVGLWSDQQGYRILSTSGTMRIDPAPITVTAKDLTTTYGTVATLDGSTGFSISSGRLYNADTLGAVTLATTDTATTDAGTTGLTVTPSAATGTGLTNYAITYAAGAVTVDPAHVTVMAKGGSSTYGARPVNPGLSASGLQNGQGVSVLTGLSNSFGITGATAAGDHRLSVAGTNANGNYIVDKTVDGTWTVKQAPITVTAKDLTTTYGTVATLDGSTGFSISSGQLYNADTLGSVTLATTDTATTDAGTTGLTVTPSAATGTGLTNYAITYAAGAVTVNPAHVTVTAKGGSSTYGARPVNPGLSASGLQNGQGVSVLTGLSNSFGITGATAAGDHTLSVAGTNANGNYVVDKTVDGIWTVKQAPITVTAKDLTTTYGTVAALDGSTGFSISSGRLYNADTLGSVTLATTDTATTDAGTTGLTVTPSAATGTGLTNYAITYAAGAVTVNPAHVTVTAKGGSSTYGARPVSPGLSASGLQNGQGVSVLTGLSNSFGITGATAAGDHTLSVAGTNANGNYIVDKTVNGTWTVKQAPITVTAKDLTTTYGTVATLNGSTGFSISSGQLYNADTLGSVTLATTDTATTDAGTTGLTVTPSAATGTGLTNYAITYAAGAVTVNPAHVTVTAKGGSSTYGARPVNPGLSASGLQNGQGVSVLTGLSNSFGITGATAAGDHTLSVAGTNANGNYIVDKTVNGIWTVKQAPITVTAKDLTTTYGTVATLDGSTGFSISSGRLYNADTLGSVTLATTDTATTDAGTTGLTVTPSAATGTGLTNYAITYAAGAVTVDPAHVTVTAKGGSSTYGARPVSPGLSASGLQNGQGVSVLTGLSNSFGITGATAAGDHTLSVAGTNANGNYIVDKTVNGTWTVKQAPITVTAKDLTTTYGTVATLDGSTGFSISSGQLYNADTLGSVTLATTDTATTDAGTTGLTVTPSAATGTGLTNYAITYAAGAVTVDPATLKVTMTGTPTKLYDGTRLATLSASDFTITGFMNGQGATITKTAGLYSSKNVNTTRSMIVSAARKTAIVLNGTYEDPANAPGSVGVTASLASGDFAASAGTDLGNYVLPTGAVSGLGIIRRAPISAAIVNVPSKRFDTSPTVSIAASNVVLSGFGINDAARIDQPVLGTFDTSSAGSDIAISAILALGVISTGPGTLMTNYLWPLVAQGSGTISPPMPPVEVFGTAPNTGGSIQGGPSPFIGALGGSGRITGFGGPITNVTIVTPTSQGVGQGQGALPGTPTPSPAGTGGQGQGGQNGMTVFCAGSSSTPGQPGCVAAGP